MSKVSINKKIKLDLDLCRYKVKIKFSLYDVLSSEELQSNEIFINSKSTGFDLQITNESNQYIHTIEYESLKVLNLRIEKPGYFPFEATYSLDIKSIYQDTIEIDLGRIGLLTEVKENAIVLTWGKTPTDLDVRLQCPNGEIVGIKQNSEDSNILSNYYASVAIDNNTGEGPELISINHWVNFKNKYKIGGKFRYYVNWFKD